MSTESSALQTELKVLQAKKKHQFEFVQKVYDSSRNLNNAENVQFVQKKVAALKHIYEEFTKVSERLNFLNLSLNPNSTISFGDVTTMDEMYGYIMYKVEQLNKSLDVKQSQQQTSTSTSSPSVSNKIKLAPLDIPVFNGNNISEWPLFHQLFKANIVDREDVPQAQKLQYLLSKLQGRAASVCSGIPATEDNFTVIWESLVSKYDDNRNLASLYMETFCSFKPIKVESSAQLSLFVDRLGATVAALKALKLPDLGEFILFYLAQLKLDDNTRKLFEMSLDPKETPSFEKLLSFTQHQAKVLSRVESIKTQPHSSNKKVHSFHINDNNQDDISKCKQFLSLSPQDRFDFVKRKSLCVNCLLNSHRTSQCPNKPSCTICQSNHNTLLHFPQGNNESKGKGKKKPHFIKPTQGSSKNIGLSKEAPSTSEESKSEKVFSSICAETVCGKLGNGSTTVLLSTVKVNSFDCNGRAQELRFLLDGGSMCNLITESACKKLNLSLEPSKTILSGIGSNTKSVQGQVTFKFSSIHDDRVKYTIQALVVGKIVDSLPVVEIDYSGIDYLKHINFADNDFMTPGPIDGILGASIYAHILNGQTVSGGPNQPIGVSTKLGYIIMGDAPIMEHSNQSNQLCMFQRTELEAKLERFWELDKVENCNYSKLTPEELKCEQHYVNNVSRSLNGRYSVSLPFSSDVSQLGDSFLCAKKRFFNLEKKLNSNPDARKGYSGYMQDLLDNGYMAKSTDQSDKSGYFIPHHMIVKPDRVSTKIRVVFDASAKTSSHYSLNDILHSGATLYNDLNAILLNFRLFPWALNGDITKMFLQILVKEEDCKFQKLLWRFNPMEPLTTYEMKVVIFGMKCSPFLAQRTVRQLVEDEIQNYPGAAKIIPCLYMDDCVASFLSEEEAKSFYSDVVKMFNSGGFTFTKWISNSKHVLDIIPESDLLTRMLSFDKASGSTKILGMSWNANEDILHFKSVQSDSPCTRRGILSAVLSIYDPMGLLGPMVFWVKLLIREICNLKLDWDVPVPDNILQSWLLFKNQVTEIETLKFPRHIGVVLSCELQLIGFCDASERGYGAIVYSRVKLPHGEVVVNLVTSKSKVAPLKVESICRLELCSLFLLSKLMKFVLSEYSPRFNLSYYCFTDSTVALCWSKRSPHHWNTFVANRVCKIQENLDIDQVFHVKGTENPADCISRGQLPSDFVKNTTFFHGPTWLLSGVENWPITSYDDLKSVELPEQKAKISLVGIKTQVVNPFSDLFSNCSSWPRLLNIIVFCLRFMKILPSSPMLRVTVGDINRAEQCVIKLVQREYFMVEIKNLQNGLDVSPGLRKLSPFLDSCGLLRVGGRLSNSNLTYEEKHPLLLPSKVHVVKLIVEHTHKTNCHTGPHLLLAIIRQKFWIIGARNFIRKIYQGCNTCFKLSPKFTFPKMGELPSSRVLESRPFFNTACDFLGPIHIVMERRRGARPVKVYVCLFICMAVKAIHLEVVSDLSTPTFLNAFKRFISRRGPIKSVLSDRGTNFVGAKNQLDEIYHFLESESFRNAFSAELLAHRIEWIFNPPASPHFGGIFESQVKAFKTHLYKVVGTQLLTYEEFLTLTTQIEALLNSRPLCPLSSDPSDCSILTPNHFLTLTSLRSIPAIDVMEINSSRLTRFQLLDQMVQSFWKRWSNEYLTQLQIREKWNTTSCPVKTGMVVLIKQDNSPPLSWPLGVITELFPGKDGITRVCTVKTSKGYYKRPVVKLAPLPTQ